MIKLKKYQKYVVQCFKAITAEEHQLGTKDYKVGHYVSYDGEPVKSLRKAHVYVSINRKDFDYNRDYPHQDINGEPHFFDNTAEFEFDVKLYFKAVPVEAVIKIIE